MILPENLTWRTSSTRKLYHKELYISEIVSRKEGPNVKISTILDIVF